MPQKINKMSNGVCIEFDTGKFDNWCVFVNKPGAERFAPVDAEYFLLLKEMGKKYGAQKIYDDFVVIYNRTSKNINPVVLDIILHLSKTYNKDADEMELLFTVLYAGMIAEENKKNTILRKRIKRLGMHQVLIDNIPPNEAAVFSKGKKWKELDNIMKSKGF